MEYGATHDELKSLAHGSTAKLNFQLGPTAFVQNDLFPHGSEHFKLAPNFLQDSKPLYLNETSGRGALPTDPMAAVRAERVPADGSLSGWRLAAPSSARRRA